MSRRCLAPKPLSMHSLPSATDHDAIGVHMTTVVAQQKADAHASRDPLAVTFLSPESGVFLWCNGITVFARVPVGYPIPRTASDVYDLHDDTQMITIPLDGASDILNRAFQQEGARATPHGRG